MKHRKTNRYVCWVSVLLLAVALVACSKSADQSAKPSGKVEWIDPNTIQPGPIRREKLSDEQMERVRAKEEDCEGLVNYALSIGDVEVAVFFRELPDGRFRVSLRSKGKLDVAHIAEEFGGGGHTCASGCSVEGPLHAAVESVLGKIRPRPQ